MIVKFTVRGSTPLISSAVMKFRNQSLPFQTTSLLIILVMMAVVGHFIPSCGVILVGVLVAISIEITGIRFRENKLAVTVLMFSTLTLLWGWFGPYIGIFARPLALLMFLSWGTYCFSSNVVQIRRIWSMPSVVVLVSAVLVQIQTSQNMIAPLLWGYDNSAHVPALSQVYRHSGFLYSGTLPELFSFSNYVNGYPPLHSGTWAFVMSVVNVRLGGGYEILNFYGFFFFGTALLIVSLISRQWVEGLSRWFEGRSQIILFLFIGVLIAFSQASYIFWLGYPSFFWTCGVIIAISEVTSKTANQSHRVAFGILGLTLVNYSYPLLSPVLVIVLISELLKMSKTDFLYCWIHKQIIAATGLLALVLNVAVVLKSLNVRKYLYDTGGIQPVEIRNLLPIVVIVIAMGLTYKYTLRSMPVVFVAFLASVINFAALAILSHRDQGSVSYYPQKAGYLALILGFMAMGGMLSGTPRLRKPKLIYFVHLVAVASTISAVWFSVRATSDPNYAKHGFVSTNMVWDQVKQNPPNPGRDCFVSAMNITSDLNLNSNKQTILYHDDLSTRWINAVRGRLTDATYSLSIPWEQGIPLPEILRNWFAQYPQARLLILAPEPPVGLEEWSDKIEFRQLACA